MTKKYLLLCLFMMGVSYTVLAYESTHDIAIYLSEMSTARAPHIIADKVVFSYADSYQNTNVVAVSFAHEQYVESRYMIKNTHGIFFVLVPLSEFPHEIEEVRYLYIIDGIWMFDPSNALYGQDFAQKKYSIFTLPDNIRGTISPHIDGQTVEFVFRPNNRDIVRMSGIDGRTYAVENNTQYSVFLAGSFNGWSPFIQPLERIEEGGERYFWTSLLVSRGIHRYYFVVNGTPILDPLNPQIVTESDGRHTSLFEIE